MAKVGTAAAMAQQQEAATAAMEQQQVVDTAAMDEAGVLGQATGVVLLVAGDMGQQQAGAGAGMEQQQHMAGMKRKGTERKRSMGMRGMVLEVTGLQLAMELLLLVVLRQVAR
jgi:hypothetical protein